MAQGKYIRNRANTNGNVKENESLCTESLT